MHAIATTATSQSPRILQHRIVRGLLYTNCTSKKTHQGFEGQRHFLTPQALASSRRSQGEGNEAQQSRGANKREAAKFLEIAVRLVSLTSRQLPRVEKVLPESINDAVLTAQGISKTTQARKRQVNLIAKLLRGLEDDDVQHIQAVLSPGHKSADEQKRDRLADKWMEGLLSSDKATAAEINSLPREWFDAQLVRRLARQYQQHLEEETDIPTASTNFDPQSKLKKQLRRELQVLAVQLLEHEAAETPASQEAELAPQGPLK